MNVRRSPLPGSAAVAVGLLLVFLAVGCDDGLRVPYIEPNLENWEEPYRGVAGLRLHAFRNGKIEANAALLWRGGNPTRTSSIDVWAYLIEHPREGWIAVGTGLEPQRSPEGIAPGLLALVAVADVTCPQSWPDQLRDAGFDPTEVGWVVLPTLRFRDTGGLKELGRARVVVDRQERRHAMQATGEYRQADFADVSSWKFIEFAEDSPIGLMKAHHDLFGDGSVVLISTPGRTPGGMAVLVRLEDRPVVLASALADGAASIRYAAKPRFAHDLGRWWEVAWRLKRFREIDRRLLVVPGEPGGWGEVESAHIVVHSEPAGEAGSPAAPFE